MDKAEFVQILQRAVAGNHTDLERIIQLYDPLITKFAYVHGVYDPELYQYLLIHIALNIHKFTI